MADDVRYRRILQAVCDTPWEILESKLELIAEIIAFRAEGGRFTDEEIRERIDAAGPTRSNQASYATASGSGGNVAILTLYGVIMPRASLFSALSGARGLTQFQQSLKEAFDDSSIAAIAIDVDSPGGQVGLVPETAAMIRDLRGQGKPIVAIANTLCASAAYHIASQADELVVTPSGQVGSIGCLAIHQDVSRMLDAAGVTTTMIAFGENKTNGYPYEPLSDKALEDIQASVDAFGSMFEADVAKGRNVGVATVHDTFGQGKMFGAAQAVKLGMADRVDTFDATVARLAHAPSRARLRGAGATAETPVVVHQHFHGTAGSDEERREAAAAAEKAFLEKTFAGLEAAADPKPDAETADENAEHADVSALTEPLIETADALHARELRELAHLLAPTDSHDTRPPERKP